ncbi:MAG: hypothetical protein QFX35_05255 [Candidatus Verstraetearchaeota archaeon]|nr:hypothetical protein [Candidatus Verstraetearchaeota archaeon]
MEEKIKTSIMIKRELWEGLKSKVGGKGGLRALSRAVEEAIEDDASDALIVGTLNAMLGDLKEKQLAVTPIKPKIQTDAGKTIREMREGAQE